jgi:hypothetical protein
LNSQFSLDMRASAPDFRWAPQTEIQMSESPVAMANGSGFINLKSAVSRINA